MVYQNFQLNKGQATQTIVTPTPALDNLPTTNSTEDWKTYTNTEYGYSLKHPPNAELKDLWSEGNPQESYMLRISIGDDILAIVTYHIKGKDETLKEFVEGNLFNFDSQKCKTQDLTIDNHDAISIDCQSKVGDRAFQQYFVYIQKDDYHLVSLHPEDISYGEDEHLKRYFDQILSTFKFIENSTVDGEIYTNSQHNYKVRVPAGWETRIREPRSPDFPGSISFIPPSEQDKGRYTTWVMIMILGYQGNQKYRYILSGENDFKEWSSKEISDGEGERLFKTINTSVDDFDAVQFVNRTLPGDPTETFYSIVTWFIKEKPTPIQGVNLEENFYIELGGNDEKQVKQYKSDYEQILSTFQFLE